MARWYRCGGLVAHLAPEHRGILGAMSPRVAQHIRAWLMHSLNRQ
ncbi:MAG TPA: hypothetical protein VFS24_19245 [Steroidobacteraceae bacterium]|nr:hypothetical protein [Steroidobacteraceae bacterium]